MKVHVVVTCIPDENEPCLPSVHGTLVEAETQFAEYMRQEWEHNAPLNEDGEKLPFPDDPNEAHDKMSENNSDWGRYEISTHEVAFPELSWRSLAKDPPGSEHREFFVGHSEGGRTDLVFRWPHPKTGKMAFWKSGKDGNYVLDGYDPDVWYPGPPPIRGSFVEAVQNGTAFSDREAPAPKTCHHRDDGRGRCIDCGTFI